MNLKLKPKPPQLQLDPLAERPTTLERLSAEKEKMPCASKVF
jgi:hypothetical protein